MLGLLTTRVLRVFPERQTKEGNEFTTCWFPFEEISSLSCIKSSGLSNKYTDSSKTGGYFLSVNWELSPKTEEFICHSTTGWAYTAASSRRLLPCPHLGLLPHSPFCELLLSSIYLTIYWSPLVQVSRLGSGIFNQ